MNRRQKDETRNMVIAIALTMLVALYWQYYIEGPNQRAAMAAMKAKTTVEQQTAKEEQVKDAPFEAKPRPELLKASPRVTIRSDSLHGSIDLTGLRFDDLTLARYHETLLSDSPEVTLFSPADDEDGYFAEFGWVSDDRSLELPSKYTLWTADATELTPEKPVTLSWKNAAGVTFTAHVALDDKYLFTITQTATDAAGKPLSLETYGYVNRAYSLVKHPVLGIVHEGPVGVFDTTLKEETYKKLTEEKELKFDASQGWFGISDKYWLSAIIPAPQAFTAKFVFYQARGRDHYQTEYVNSPATATTLHFFAGAKQFDLLETYAAQYHIPLFDRAVDFGMFWWLAEPLFRLLAWFHAMVGNFGIAILLLTVVVKLCLYPLASKSYAAMNQMKDLQPRMTELRERFKGDKMQMNQAIMELYKREKVNPASGCLPIFIQIPVFISLYKVLSVTIEMRHAPFYGWVHDLSAPDPTNVFNALGLIAWSPPSFLHLGVWPLLMCLTMIIQQRQSPPPADPGQAAMMKFMPFFFLFLFSNVAAGLAIYWTWSNTLSILQQWHIRRSHDARKRRKAQS